MGFSLGFGFRGSSFKDVHVDRVLACYSVEMHNNNNPVMVLKHNIPESSFVNIKALYHTALLQVATLERFRGIWYGALIETLFCFKTLARRLSFQFVKHVRFRAL